MRQFCFFLTLATCVQIALANNEDTREDSSSVVTNPIRDNWFAQVGFDMWLQNPYGTNFMNVFPNGKSFGVDVALGKWLTPEYGVRGKINWEAGIIKSDHAEWVNTKKGYLVFAGDFLVNLKNFFGEYNSDRKWNVYAYPRAGVLINFREKTYGSPILGLGLGETYRLNNRWCLYGDVAYQVSSSAIGAGIDTGTGSGSNGYFDFNIGVQYNFGNDKFYRVSEKKTFHKHSVVTNSFWDNWFVQAGLGMSLLNPYGGNFSKVFPNGKSFGINMAIGKWFVPELGLRAGLNWQNGILPNNHISWIDRKDDPGSNHRAGGYIAAYIDAFVNLHHVFSDYNENRRWNLIVFPRAGIASNLESGSGSPLAGLGVENTYKLNDRLKLFADIAYQVTTSEFLGTANGPAESEGHKTSYGSNGWFDINVGVQYELGQVVGWSKPNKVHGSGFMVNDGHNWPWFIVNTGASVVVAFGAKTALKAMIKEERPDHSDNKSFPSGHAAIAFAAARSIDKEFRKDCIWIPIAGYAAATAIGIERVASDRHHWYDVVAGAAVGFGSAELTWWLSDKLFGKGSNVALGSSGNSVDVAVTW